MAGIISNVTGDIQRLRDLKTAIEDVKKSLMSINIKVNIDMKENLEAKLKSLTDKYMELGTKVALTEAKINQSAQNIVKAAQKITEAQDKMSKAPINAIPTSGGSVSVSNTPAISAEKVEVIAQAKAYNELKEQIGDIIGARGQNIKRMIEEQNAIRLINAEIKQITKSQGEYSKVSASQQKRLEQLNNSLLTHKTVLAEVRQNLSNNVKLDNAAATSMNELSQSLSRMRIAYRELTEEGRKSPFGKELLTSINRADAEIKGLDATIGNHARNVGNYKAKWDGLGMSIQQIGREMPSLAYGPKVFFSAISNNLPILADELKRAKAEFKALKAEGKDATPVWKQVTSSLLSWQTALTVGVTLLTLYGDKLVDLVSGLFNAKNAVKELLSAEQEMSLARKKAISDSTKERTELDLLYNKLKSTTISTKERNAAVSEWMKKYPQHSSIMNGELVNLGKLDSAYQSLSKQIIEAAKARAYSDKITELTKKRDDAEFRRLNSLNSLEKSKDALANNDSDLQRTITHNAQKQYDAIVQEVANYDSKIESIGKNIKLDNLFPQPKEGTYDYWQQQVQIADTALKQIASKQKTILDNAAKEQKKDLYALGIDKSIVDSYKSAVQAKKEAEKELEAYPSSSESTKQENQAEKLRKEQEKLAILMDKQALDQSRSEQDLQNQVDQSRIDAMADGFDKQQEQRDLNNKKEIQSLKRQKEDYIRAIIQAEKEKFDAQEDVKAQQKKGYVKRTFDSSSVTVDTSKQDKIISNTETKQGVDEWLKREASMNEYLLKYGTFTQKKEAIDKKYQDAISKETDLGNKNSLQKEWDESLANLDLSKLKQNINWEMIFGDLNKVTKEQLTNIKKQLQEFKKSDEFKNATPEQIQVIEGALNSINNAMVDKGGFFGGMVDSVTELRLATEELKKAEEELAEANKKGTEAQKEEAQKKVNQAKNNQQNAETNVTKSSDKTIQHLTSVGDAISQLGSTAEMSLSSFGDAAGNIVDAFSEAGSKLGGIVGAVFSILEGIQKQGIDGFIGNIFDNIMGVAGSVWNTLTFGAFDSLGLSGESDEGLEKDLERLSQSNEDLKIALDNLAERMEESSVADATDVYEKQKAALLQSEANTKESMRREAASYSNGFLGIGGSHSSNAKIDSSMSSSDWSKISEIVGHTVNGASDFWNLTSEEMANVATEANDLYTKIKVHADDGHRDAAQYMDTYISYYNQLEELENAWREKLTSASFGTIRDDFKSALMDMEADTEDFVKNFEELMKNAMFEDLMTKKYDVMLQAWYKDFATAMDGGKLTKDEQNDLKGKWDKIVNEGIAERDALYEMMGWETSSSTSQDSTKGMSQSMDQDTGNELNGRFTALQIAGEEIKNQNILQSQSLNLLTFKADAILSVNTEVRNIADETRTILANSYLELVQISENTGESAKYLKEIKSDIAEVKKNTKAMAG